jgi:NAD(P)-dependent dehydrogenase (short-subunit alcohol dehydrogenase family)/pimeloyl-ACP methyl ester carboxylesterase
VFTSPWFEPAIGGDAARVPIEAIERRPVRGQVVVVTGASAGVGRAVVRAFAARRAGIGLIARGTAGLEAAAAEVTRAGGRPLILQADVADPAQVEAAADRVEDELGPIDVWVNNAFAGVLAPFWQVTPEEFGRVTQVTYLGTVNGTRAALSRMRRRDRGVIVQVGSALAHRSIPLQSAYCGAKHAIAGFTESLRTELLHEGSAVRVTMVQLPALNTPQFDWVLSRMPGRAQPVPPIYEPEVAADAIVRTADRPVRERWVGGSTVVTLLAQKVAPGLLDRYLGRTGVAAQQAEPHEPAEPAEPGERAEPPGERSHNLWEPRDADRDHGARGRFDGQARPARSGSFGGLVKLGSLGDARKPGKPRKSGGREGWGRLDGGRLVRRVTIAQGLEIVGWHRTPVHAAPSVVCVHGAGVSSRQFHPLVAELGREVDAWTVDLPGYGRSAKASRPLTLSELGDALAAWLNAADLAPTSLVGCSFGCQIAVDVAVRYPELVRSLVLAGPTTDAHARTWPRLLARWLRNSVNEDPRMLPLNLADYLDAGPRRVITAFRESKRDRIEDRLAQVGVPTLVVRGELDRITPSEWVEEVTRLLPAGRLVTVPGTAHTVPVGAPREMARLVTEFVQ